MRTQEKQKILKRGGKNTQKNWTKKHLNDSDNYDGVVTYLEPDILEYEVKRALGSVTTNKATGGDGIPAELFKTLKDDTVKLLHSVCQQIWKIAVVTALENIRFHSNPKEEQHQRMFKLLYNCAHFIC